MRPRRRAASLQTDSLCIVQIFMSRHNGKTNHWSKTGKGDLLIKYLVFGLGGCIYKNKTIFKKCLSGFFVLLGDLNNILKVYQSLFTRKVSFL